MYVYVKEKSVPERRKNAPEKSTNQHHVYVMAVSM